jgi:hypothetical protein
MQTKMAMTWWATPCLAMALCALGCAKQNRDSKPEPKAEAPTSAAAKSSAAAAPAAAASSRPSGMLDACQLKMTAPEAHEWKTYWNSGGSRGMEGPSFAHSSYWANEHERESLQKTGNLAPLDIQCTSDQGTKVAVVLDAYGSSEKDVPLGPGSYSIVGKTGGGKPKAREFLANIAFGKSGLFDATGGTLKIDRFDDQGVAGSFSVDAHEIVTGARPVHIEGTFDLPCRGGMLEGACKAKQASRP